MSTNTCTDTGTSSYSIRRRRSSSAMSLVTSRDQPSAVLKATMRAGWPYWPSIRLLDQRLTIGGLRVGLPPRAAKPGSKILQHQIGVRPFGYTHDATHRLLN